MTNFKQTMNIPISYEYKPILLASSDFNITLIFTFLLYDLPCMSPKYVLMVHERGRGREGVAFEIMTDGSYQF